LRFLEKEALSLTITLALTNENGLKISQESAPKPYYNCPESLK
jgi:hypothetical protein